MSRATTSAIAVPLLVGIAVVLAAVVGSVALGFAPPAPSEPVVLSVTASADGRIEVLHEAGPPIDLHEVEVLVEVDGVPLDHQPPVPFFSATGFHPGPTGPFNRASDDEWERGERASFRIAGTNDPEPSVGDTVTVRIVREGLPIAVYDATVDPA